MCVNLTTRNPIATSGTTSQQKHVKTDPIATTQLIDLMTPAPTTKTNRCPTKSAIQALEGALSDSDFANDKDKRYSVYGYIIYFCGVPVAWKSKSMKSVSLSTTEAEYVAVSEVVKKIKFLYQMLRSMEIKVPPPIKVQVDHVGAIWLAK